MNKLILISIILLMNFQIVFGQNKKIVKGGILNGKATYLPKPNYPQKAKDFCAGGKVEVEVLVSEKGDVIEAKAVSGDELLREISVDAVKRAKFSHTPHLIAKIRGIIIYNFDPLVECIGAGIVNKKAISLPKPKVANLNKSRSLRITKDEIVAVQIVIDMSGKVVNAQAITGHPMFRSACENSARTTKFHPTLANIPPIKIRALLVYKFKSDATIDTDIERDDESVAGTPINLIKPPPPFCNCIFGGSPSISVEAKTDERGNVIEAKAINGHPILKNISEKAALESKFLPTNVKAKILIQYNFESTWDSGREVKIKNIEIRKVQIEE